MNLKGKKGSQQLTTLQLTKYGFPSQSGEKSSAFTKTKGQTEGEVNDYYLEI